MLQRQFVLELGLYNIINNADDYFKIIINKLIMFIDLTLDNDSINRRYLIAVDDISVVEEAGEGSYIMLKSGGCLSVKESVDYVKSLLNAVK